MSADEQARLDAQADAAARPDSAVSFTCRRMRFSVVRAGLSARIGLMMRRDDDDPARKPNRRLQTIYQGLGGKQTAAQFNDADHA